jgi:hypothetical protein
VPIYDEKIPQRPALTGAVFMAFIGVKSLEKRTFFSVFPQRRELLKTDFFAAKTLIFGLFLPYYRGII